MASKKHLKSSSDKKSSIGKKEEEIHHILTGQVGTSMTASNSAGSYVGTAIEFDTDFCARTVVLGATYEQFCLHWIELEYRPLVGTTVVGETGHCFVEDPTSGNPGSGQAAGDVAQSTTPRQVFQKLKHKYIFRNTFFFCKDSSSDKRLEMPGNVIFWNEGCETARVMGTLHYTMSITFRKYLPSSMNIAEDDEEAQKRLWNCLFFPDAYRIPEKKVTRYTVPRELVDGKQVVQQLDNNGHVIGEQELILTNNVVTTSKETLKKEDPKTTQSSKNVVAETKRAFLVRK